MKDKKEPLLESDSLFCGSWPLSPLSSPKETDVDDDDDDDPPVPLFSHSTSHHNWPNIYDEAYEMSLVSIMMYGLIDLRKLARQGRLSNSDEHTIQALLELPIAAPAIVRLVAQNRDAIIQQAGEESTEAYLQAFDAIVEDESFELQLDPETGATSLASFDVVAVDDEHADKELVYGICVHSARKRITVAFRGCSSRRDWRIAADNYLIEYELRNDGGADCPAAAMHRGFSQYLLLPRPSSDSSQNTYETIAKTVRSLLEQHPTYHIYVTGHSLGGALATVFTYLAAATDNRLGSSMPITCINFASPMVGNLSFEVSFKTLQRNGWIRCLRVTNDFDIFTQLPDRASYLYALPCCWGPHACLPYYITLSFVFFACCQSRVYRHVGMNLRLYASAGRYKFKHPKDSTRGYLCRMLTDWKKYLHHSFQRAMSVPLACLCACSRAKVDLNKIHSIVEHMRRLKTCAVPLQNKYLNDLYEEKRLELV